MKRAAATAVKAVKDVLVQLPLLQGQRVLAAVSGGADSALMLYALHQLAPRLGFDLCAAHVNHGLHPRAPDLENSAAQWAKSLGVPLQTVNVTVTVQGHEGLEQAARRQRHAALETARVAAGCAWITLGHNMTDAAETYLQRVLEGAGRGQASMPPVDTPKVRPLIGVTRAQVRELVAALNITHTQDPMNEDPAHLRVFMRQSVWPVLQQRFGCPERTLARAALHAQRDDEALELAAQGTWNAHGVTPRQTLAALPLAVRTRALLHMVEHAAGRPVRTGGAAVNQAALMVSQRGGRPRRLKVGPVWLWVDGESVWASRESKEKV